MTETRTGQEPIHLRECENGESQIVIHPEDDDLFVRTGRQVIDACRLDISIELWVQEFRSMVEQVRSWAEERAGQVRCCYCVPRSTRMVLFFCPATAQFDFALADELVELNLALRQDFNVGVVEVQQIPWDEASRFFQSDAARWVYGQRMQSTSAPVET